MGHRTTIGFIIFLLGVGLIIWAGIAAIIFRIQNVDMTEMRMLIENPTPTILAIIGYIVGRTGISLMKR